jgi:hypothetical protein
MPGKHHVIGSSKFEIEYLSDENGLQFRTYITRLIKETLLQVIEEVFDELDPARTLLRIDKLELDLGTIGYPVDEIMLRQMFRKQLTDSLNFKVVALRHIKHAIEPGDALIPLSRSREELILYFLQHGYLPWWGSESAVYTQSVATLLEEAYRPKPAALVRLFRFLRHQKEAQIRLLHHLPESLFYATFQVHTGIQASIVAQAQEEILKSGLPAHLPDAGMLYKYFLVQHILLAGKTSQRPTTAAAYTELFVKDVAHTQPLSVSLLAGIFPEYFMPVWIALYYPAYQSLFENWLRVVREHTASSDKRARYKVFFKTFMEVLQRKNRTGQEVALLTQEVLKALPASDKLLTAAILKIAEEAEGDFSDDPPVSQQNSIERAVLHYLMYGIIAWEDRSAGVQGIEIHLRKMHRQSPKLLHSLFAQIPTRYFPAVLRRIEQTIDPAIADFIFKEYFSREEARRIQNSVQYREDIVKLFFQKGTAPWIEIVNQNIEFVEQTILNFHEKDPEYFVRILKEYKIHQQPDFIARISEIFGTKLTTLIETILKSVAVSDPENKTAVVHTPPDDPDEIIYYLTYFEKHRGLPTHVAFSVEALIENFISKHKEASKLYFSTALYAQYKIVAYTFSDKVKNILETLLQELKTDQTSEKKKTENKKDSGTLQPTDDTPALKTNEPIYIVNAGLVLVHPFLQRFFSLCNLLEKRKFKDEAAAHKAVFLLQYLANKGEQAEEHQLVLNKLLCGIDLSVAIDRSIELSEEDKETCESLLSGVVGNWPILKKTSNDNFRVSFLQREGRLTLEDASWRLKVEEKGYDVLVDQLPWALNPIKLPWMPKMLSVEWR